MADDESGKILWWDQMCSIMPDGRIYTLILDPQVRTSEDLNNHWRFRLLVASGMRKHPTIGREIRYKQTEPHWTISEDQGRTWTEPKPTNLRGQVCTPIPLPDGRVAAIYNFRHEPQGIHVALTEDLSNFDTDNEAVVFDAGAEATLGDPDHPNFLAEHMLICFAKPGGVLLANGDLMTYFWCTFQGVTHTRWVRLQVD